MKHSFLTKTLFVLAAMAAGTASYGQAHLPFITTFTHAEYGDDFAPDDTDTINFPVVTPPGFTESQSTVAIGGNTGFGRHGHPTLPDLDVAWDDSDAYAYGSMPGLERLYAHSGGWSPGGTSNLVRSFAQVDKHSNWLASGPGATASIDLFYFLDGFLYTSSNSGGSDLVRSGIEVEMTLQSSLGTSQIFLATAELNHINGLGATANWLTSFADTTGTMTSTNGHDHLWEMSFSDLMSNVATVPVGEVFDLHYRITSYAYNDHGPSEIFATSDFSHTGEMNLASGTSGVTLDQVNLSTVPEPASLTAVVLLAGAAIRRRKQVI